MTDAAPASAILELEHVLAPGLTIRRFGLANGLKIVLLVDPATPIVSYQTWFRVGSRHEEPGKTGMAHLFEHLMFNRTEGREPGAFDRAIDRTGGESNAATWVDWTYYRDSIPARDLGLVVELEAERMVKLVLDDRELESEREVVANERVQRIDDDLDGFIDEELHRLAFRHHPYRWPTIGWMEDIRSLARPDIQRFYQTYYAPNNATLVIVGDVDPVATLALVDRHYGGIPPAAIPPHAVVVEPAQREERRARFVKPTATPRLVMGWVVPAQRDPDWAVLSFAAAILASGPSARLHRALVVDSEIASSVGCDLSPYRDAALFTISATLTAEHGPAEAEAVIERVLAGLAAVPAAELAKVANIVETDFWAELDTLDGRAEALGHYETTLGDFRALFEVADRLARVSAADLARVTAAHLGPHQRSIVTIDPEAPDDDDDGDRDDDGELA